MRPPAITERGSIAVVSFAAFAGLALHIATPAFAGDEAPPASTAWLRGEALQVEVSPRLGGRMLHLSLPGSPNLLKVGDAVAAQPDPNVDAEAGDIGYLGHQVWLGPVSYTHLDVYKRQALGR